MRYEIGKLKNIKFQLDNYNMIIGVEVFSDEKNFVCYKLYDNVNVKADETGFIGKGISHEGVGHITNIRHDENGFLFAISMNNREYGYVHFSRISKV